MFANGDIIPSVVVLGLVFLLFWVPALLARIARERRPHHTSSWGRLYDKELH